MLIIDEQVKMLGPVRLGIPHTIKYKLINKANENLAITKVAPGCSSCTTVVLDQRTLMPGESVDLTAIFTPGSLGITTKTITLFYKIGAVELNLTLKFKAIVGE